MPIKGLSDRGLAFPEIGHIRKGAVKGENRPGKNLKYFRFDFAEGEEQAAATIASVYGPEPNHIRILLPFNEIDKMWDPWKEAYTAGRLVGRSDGEFIQYQVDARGEMIVKNGLSVKTGTPVPHPANNIAGYDYKNNPVEFKNNGRLKVMIPELKRAAYMTLMTTSTHDIANISDQLAAFHKINGGQIAGIPFILSRKPKEISTPKSNTDKTRVRRVEYLISIEVDPAWAAAKFGAMHSAALPTIPEMPQLEAGMDYIELDEDELDHNQPLMIEDEPLPDIEMIDPMGGWAVQEAAKEWNIETSAAAKEIAKMKLGKMISKNEFLLAIKR